MITATFRGRLAAAVARIALSVIVAMNISGCSPGAPSLPLFGAYFPAWLACLLFGVAVALATRAVLLRSGGAVAIPMELLVCTCAGIIGGIVLSWLWTGG